MATLITFIALGALVLRLRQGDNVIDKKDDFRRRHISTRPTAKQAIGDQKRRVAEAQKISEPCPELRVFSGKAYVTDGDGLRIKKEEIRLFGVDAPEFHHPHGKAAKWALFELTRGQIVRVEVTGQDQHGRTVAKCSLPDGRDLSAEMVKKGLALDWPKFSGGVYRRHEPAGVRKKLWLADARQKGRMHVWEAYQMDKNRPKRQNDNMAGKGA